VGNYKKNVEKRCSRKNEALERGYLMGRYGGIPFLNHTLGVHH